MSSVSTPVKVGDPIPLNLQLGLEESSLFVEATVRDESGVEVAGSPTTLSHVAGGLYKSLSVLMPDSPTATAQYRVYEDAGLTTRSDTYPVTETDTFSRDETKGLIDALSAQVVQGDLVATVEEIELLGVLESAGELSASKVEEENLGVVEESDLSTQIEDTETAGIIE